ncbi:cytosolic phospholipase A2 zeta [Zalerion maritima]|uniref:Lysophospholipase n=1 Tax=Zalerion maritima TaxID=339359 RepID=A0AAD5S0M5_9PEZI|nr:cytosolic phospholipase A2 zeta [Zalerion maritima]
MWRPRTASLLFQARLLCLQQRQAGTRRSLSNLGTFPRQLPYLRQRLSILRNSARRDFFTRGKKKKRKVKLSVASAVILGTGIVCLLPTREELKGFAIPETITSTRSPEKFQEEQHAKNKPADQLEKKGTAWFNFATKFEAFSNIADVEWATFSDRLVGLIAPEWSKNVPVYMRKLQRELSMAPGSLADEIWSEAHDPCVHPEIQYSATVRVSDNLCDEEKEFLSRRKKVTAAALARYLGLGDTEVHPDDVPTIAICGSGGGLRALTAGAGAMLATEEDGLFDCATYTSGVSGSCWLQSLYNSSIANGCLADVIDHLKARVGVHMAYPPVAFNSVISAPTNKHLLSGLVEKLRGDPNADFGLVDIYGILLSGRLLVPKGELGINEKDFKLSNQRSFIQYGEHPLPIYTAVRHEIPDLDISSEKGKSSVSEDAKAKAKKEAWFQWYELTPYEFFCEEFNAGIPTWALGRRFKDGVDVAPEHGFHLPETRLPFLMGIFGSAFCATLSHYYQEIRPLVKSLTGFGALDDIVTQRNENLSKVHPIDPATIPNFAYGMEGKLPKTTPTSVAQSEYIQLMDAGMSNNLPVYPLMRPGRDVEVIIAFDTSADVKTDNWLSVADGYAKQRGIKGWPIGIGWPKSTDPPQKVEKEYERGSANTTGDARDKIIQAQEDQAERRSQAGKTDEKVEQDKFEGGKPKEGELGYCTIWVGSTEERSSEPPPPSKAIDDENRWKLTSPDAGMTVIYLPFMSNPKVPGVNPGSSDYLSTWNFVYTPEQVDNVVNLARANYDEGKEQIRSSIRAVYDRKKKLREEKEKSAKQASYRRRMRLGLAHKLGEGDQFS